MFLQTLHTHFSCINIPISEYAIIYLTFRWYCPMLGWFWCSAIVKNAMMTIFVYKVFSVYMNVWVFPWNTWVDSKSFFVSISVSLSLSEI